MRLVLPHATAAQRIAPVERGAGAALLHAVERRVARQVAHHHWLVVGQQHRGGAQLSAQQTRQPHACVVVATTVMGGRVMGGSLTRHWRLQ